MIKIDELVAKIKKAFKDLFGEWDFDKIGKALKQFYNEKSHSLLYHR